MGWNTEPDASGTHFDLDTEYYVDTEDPVTLYAEWKVKVYFHRNKNESAWGSVSNWSEYTAEGSDVYYTAVYLNQPVDAPTDIPITTANPTDNLYFRYWGTQRYGDAAIIDAYDFSAPVTDELHLYAFWAGPIELPIHVLDSSAEPIVSAEDWRQVEKIEVHTGDVVEFTESGIAADYVNVPDGYVYAFTAVHNRTDSIQNISEDDEITQVYYNVAERVLYVKYADEGRDDAPLADTDEIYFVYYRTETVDIGYKVMSTSGGLSDASMGRNGYPASCSVGTYIVDGSSGVNLPLYWANQSAYKYYAYAIGTPNATTASQLQLITPSSNSDNSRPNLQIRNTWRGFQYSTDNGSTWSNCGYDGDIQLYVVYFTTDSQPTIVTVKEQTIGTAADMEEEFEYVVVVTETTTTTTSIQRQQKDWWGNYSPSGNANTTTTSSGPNEISNNTDNPYILSNGESQSITLFNTTNTITSTGSDYTSGWNTYRDVTTTTITTVQTITVTQRLKSGFDTSNSAVGGGTSTQPYTWTYTTTSTAATPTVTYTNTHTPLTVEVHVALVGAGGITLDDNERADTHSFEVPIDLPEDASDVKTILSELPEGSVFTGDRTVYGFAGIVYGTGGSNQGDSITLAGSGISTVTYGNISDNVYELFFDRDPSRLMGDYEIYYLYYPLPKVVYVKETAGGALVRIKGSTDESSETETITYDGAVLNLNGEQVAQQQLLSVTTDLFTISQTVSGGIFNMPPLLDDGTEKLYLSYSKIGTAGTANATNTSALAGVTESKLLYLQVIDNQVKWSFDNAAWNSFTDTAPTVYAIYKELGYALEITKTVTGPGADPTKAFTVTISSDLITNSSYDVSGIGYPTISAVPATSSAPGTIVLTVKHGSDITISGLPKGSYSITESAGAKLTAKIGDVSQTVRNNTIDIALNANTKLDLFNEMQLPAPTGWQSDTKPYALMLMAGVLLLATMFLATARRKRAWAEGPIAGNVVSGTPGGETEPPAESGKVDEPRKPMFVDGFRDGGKNIIKAVKNKQRARGQPKTRGDPRAGPESQPRGRP